MVYTEAIPFSIPDRDPMLQVNSKHLIDDAQCYQTSESCVGRTRCVPSCESKKVIKRGFDDTELARQRYACHDCDTRFDDRTDTMFAGHSSASESMGLVSVISWDSMCRMSKLPTNCLSIESDVQQMTAQLREGL